MALETYNSKRNFSHTPEPRGGKKELAGNSVALRFVVQEHSARALHYDFRLEMDGVLVSWAVPKGPPASANVRRLAIHVEDHPLDYIDFAGEIPEGNYGAGTVSIWDRGTYQLLGVRSPRENIDRGKVEVMLSGTRLNGKYDLIRTNDEKDEWIFIKSSKPAEPISLGMAAPMPSPDQLDCMLAVTGEKPFDNPAWLFEIKWDGYRALLFCDTAGSHLYSRNHQPFDQAFPELNDASQWLNELPAVLDGEIVALTADGKPNFQSLQNKYGFQRRGGKSKSESPPGTSILYMAFDILYLDGKDLTNLPLIERKKILAALIKPNAPLRYSEHVSGKGIELFNHLSKMGMEGVMGKRANSRYMQSRSDSWVKIKAHRSSDVVVAGYTESKAAGRPFASLLVGAYSGKKLVSLGHVGTGYNAASMSFLTTEMNRHESSTSPYEDSPKVNGKAHWLKPELVAEVNFSEVTGDGQLRHPVFVRLRTDKPATECKLEDIGVLGSATEMRKDHPEPLIDQKSDSVTLEIDGQSIHLTHLNKIFWKEAGTVKRDLVQYYAAIAPIMLKHLKDRPIVVQRYPDGVGGMTFFQHDAGNHVPGFVRTFSIDEHNGPVRYALLDTTASLLYFANLGAIPIHTWNGCAPNPNIPDRIIFDLDPTDRFAQSIPVALELKNVLEKFGLKSYPKTSGAEGLHICVPINPEHSTETVVEFARTIGRIMVDRFPALITTQRLVKNRKKEQVYLDCLQNGAGKTVVAAYSVRAQPTPTVSTPLFWDEVNDDLDPLEFTIDTLPMRVAKLGDLYSAVTEQPQQLDAAIKKAKNSAKGK